MLLFLLACDHRSIMGCPEAVYDLGPDDRFEQYQTPAEFAMEWDDVALTAAAGLPPGRITVEANQATATVLVQGSCGAADTLTYRVPAALVVGDTMLHGELYWDWRDMYSEATLGVEGDGPPETVEWFSHLLGQHDPTAGPVHSFASAWLLQSREARFRLYWDGANGPGETSWQDIPELVQPFEITSD